MITAEDLIIVHYYHPNCVPFMNICRLSKGEAFSLAHKMAADNPETESFYRFADAPQGFASYYPRRMITDEYLYNQFASLGGKPRQKHPLSFVLGGSEWLHKHYFSSGHTHRIGLSTIPSEHISFTLGDSMRLLVKDGVRVDEIQHGQVTMYTKEMLLRAINEYGTLDDYMEYVTDKYKYIEAQLWNDEYCVV